jgi:hypothetical protein
MTDGQDSRKQAVAGIIRAVVRKTAVIDGVAAAAALVYALSGRGAEAWWFVPAGILFGGLLGVLNFRWLAVSVERFYLRKGATPGVSNVVALFMSGVKLTLIFIVLFIVIKWHLVHVFGLVIGLSLSFVAILWEGARLMKQTLNNEGM